MELLIVIDFSTVVISCLSAVDAFENDNCPRLKGFGQFYLWIEPEEKSCGLFACADAMVGASIEALVINHVWPCLKDGLGESLKRVRMADAIKPKLALQDVIKHLTRYSPAQCEFCGSKRWTVYTDESDGAITVQGNIQKNNPEGVLTLGGAVPVIQVQCCSCGQVKYFAVDRIVEGLREMHSKEANNG